MSKNNYSIQINECYPVYSLDEDEPNVKIPARKVRWIEKVEAEYAEVQFYLSELQDDR